MMLQKLNRVLGRVMPLLTPTSVVLGVLLSQFLNGYEWAVPWIFAFITFAGSLSANFQSLRHALSHPLPMILALFVLHIFMPLFAWGSGNVYLKVIL